eukprot:gene6448-301_t
MVMKKVDTDAVPAVDGGIVRVYSQLTCRLPHILPWLALVNLVTNAVTTPARAAIV